MAHGAKLSQEIHDRKLQQMAIRYLREGKKVLVDLPGHHRPPAIGGFIPDAIVKDNNKIIKIIEVETPESVAKDKKQNEAFEKEAKRLGIEFIIAIAKPKTQKS